MTRAETPACHRHLRGPKSFALVPLISAAMVVPFVVLEWINRRSFHEDLPLVLFGFMSVHSLLIVLTLMPGLRRLRAEQRLGGLRLGHWSGLVLGAILVYAYVGVVVDQMPCFLGVPNCD